MIIKDWNYTFEDGKIYGLIGRNGMGKTTIMKCISGLYTPDSLDICTEKGNVKGNSSKNDVNDWLFAENKEFTA